ncbi:MAG TPA: FtsQ-type POTRA domain-containing protein [Gemmatimonadales bacterium]|nr:FtsQ-type POTRA domain-containing protein [Gemmatimonadales bacterium]
MAERGLKRILWLLGAGGGALVLWLVLPLGLRHLEFFRVRQVEIVGLQYLDAAEVVRAAGLASRASVFDDHEPAAARIRALPGVTGAEVGIRAPGTLRIELTEAEPVALTPKGDRLAMVDRRARVLPFDPLGSAPDLPVLIGGGELVAAALARAKEFDPALFARIDAAWRVGPDVVFEVGGRWFWFGSRLTAEDIRAVTAAEQALARQGRAYQELDGRFAGQVVVRKARA